MDSTSRQNILNEVKSSIDDDPTTKLEDRFGSVNKLAATYLEGMPERTTWFKRIGSGVKWVFIGLGILFALAIFVIWCLFSYFTNGDDDFNYADVNDPELSQMQWKTLSTTPETINVFQSRLVVYTGDYQEMTYSCEREDDDSFVYENATQTLNVLQNACYVRIPSSVKLIEGRQADIVMTDLGNDMTVDVWQAQLRLAFNEPVTLVNEVKSCEFAAENNLKGGVYTLTIKGKWCAIDDYKFEAK